MATTTSTMFQTDPPALMPFGRVLRAYATEAKFESLRMLRTPGMAIPFLLLPVPIYLFFGVVLAAPAIAQNSGVANYLFSGWCVFATMGPALFGVGCALAAERDARLFQLKRALPAPGGSWLVAKTLMAMAFAALAVASLVITAVVAGTTTLSAGQFAALASVMIVGAIPFCAIGLCIGAYTSGSTAPAFANVVFLPMLWLSGLFIPLPKFLEPWVVVWPAFHLNQIALASAGMTDYRFIAPQMSVAVLAGLTVLFGGLAISRLAKKG